jgi:PAS domain S-box-containing protein
MKPTTSADDRNPHLSGSIFAKAWLPPMSFGTGIVLSLLGATDQVSLALSNSGWIGISPMTGIVFLFVGIGLAACAWPGAPLPKARLTTVICAVLACVIGAERLAELLNVWFHHGDITPPAGIHLMSPGSALCALLLGGALLLCSTRRYFAAFQALVVMSMIVSWMGIVHAVIGNEPLFALVGMALPSAIGFMLLAFGILCLRQDGGLIALLVADNAGGSMARRLLPFVMTLPLFIGWLRLQGEGAGWYGSAGGTALAVSASIMTLCTIVFFNARALSRSDGERRNAQAMLALAQQVAHLGHVVVTFTEHSNHPKRRFWSDETFRLLGYQPGAVAPSRETFLAALHPDDRPLLDQAYATILATNGTPTPLEFRVVRPDGGYRFLHAIIAVERDSMGRPLDAIFTFQDITERRTAENRLNQQMARLDLLRQATHAIGERLDLTSIMQVVIACLEDNLPVDFVCCCRHDANAQVLTVTNIGQRSAALAKIVALDLDASIPTDADCMTRCVSGQLVHESDVAELPFAFPKRLASAGLRSFVLVPIVVDGAVVFVLIVAQLQPGSFSSMDCEFFKHLGEQLALAVHQAQLYADLQGAYDEQNRNQQAMMQLERLRVLGQMASGIAHDINNAISPAMLYTEWILLQSTGLDPEARQQLATVKRAIEDVAHTVARLGEFYRRDDDSANMVAIDLNVKIQHVIELTQARWSDLPQQRGAVITVRKELQPDLPSIKAVASEVREALINFVFNAVDAMPEGGTLTVRTRTTEDRVVVEVSDTGIGMSREVRQRCLEPFFTTKGERGTGIGLAMVHGIAQRHGADILIESEVGRGTTMGLAFPYGKAPATWTPVTSVPVPMRLKILVVDDDPRLINTLVDILKRDHHEVMQAEGGQAGIDTFLAARTSEKPFDVVITDLGMPHVDGRMVASAIKKAAAKTPVIMLTGWGQRLVTGGTAPQVDRILDKPPTVLALRQALSQLFPTSKD